MSRTDAVIQYLQIISRMSGLASSYLEEKPQERKPDAMLFSPAPSPVEEQLLSFLHCDTISQLGCGQIGTFSIEPDLTLLACHFPDHEGYGIVGPYREHRPSRAEIIDYAARYSLSAEEETALYRYLCSCVSSKADPDLFSFLCSSLFESESTATVACLRIPPGSREPALLETSPLTGDLDGYYEQESELRHVIGPGKSSAAAHLLKQRDRRIYTDDPLINALVRLLSLNIICKQALTEAGIPSILIEQLYGFYVRDISGHRGELPGQEEIWEERMLTDYGTMARQCASRRISERMRTVTNYVLAHYQEKLSVQRIAQELNLTPNYLSSQFKKETGDSLSDYIRKIRIDGSLTLLGNTTLSISQIAEKVGFDDYNYFSRVFHRQMGLSPSEYRCRYKEITSHMYATEQTLHDMPQAQ